MSEFADRLPELVDAIRASGIRDAPAQLLQVFAGVILLHQSRSKQTDTADYSQLATVQDQADARAALLRLWWQSSSRVLNTKAPLPIPELITAGGKAAATVVQFLWNEAELHPVNNPTGRQSLLGDLERVIEFWLRESKYARSFATPPLVAELMMRLADPQPGEYVYDPCCGIGGLLSGASARLSQALAPNRSSGDSEPSRGRIVGMELDSSLYIIALARILLNGDIQPELRIGNTLAEPLQLDNHTGRFDCILANLPFGVRQPKELIWNYPIHTSASESLFVQHVLSRLRSGGRAVIVVPESFLFRRGADVNLRQKLLESYSVESVWSLPPGTFAASSSLKTSIVVIRNEGPRKEVVFVGDKLVRPLFDKEVSMSGAAGSGKTDAFVALVSRIKLLVRLAAPVDSRELPPSTEDIRSTSGLPTTIASTGRGWHIEKAPADLVTKIPIQELAERYWELLPKRTGVEELRTFLDALQQHVGRIDLAKLIDIAEVFSGIAYRTEDLIRTNTEDKPSLSRTPDLSLSDAKTEGTTLMGLVRVQDVGPKQGKDRYPTIRRPLAFLRSQELSKIREHHQLRTGDILLTRSGTVGNLGLVDDGLSGSVPANGIIVIRPNHGYNSLALLRLLQTAPYQNWFQGNASGSVIQHLPTRSVRDLAIPLFDREEQDRLAGLNAGDNIEAVLRAFRVWSGESLWATFVLHDPSIESLIREGRSDGYTAEWWESLRSSVSKCARLGDESAAADQKDQVAQSMSVWVRHAGRLLDTMELPVGLERYAALKTWDQSINQQLWAANTQSDGNSQAPSLQAHILDRLSSLSELLVSAADVEADRIADSATLGIELQVRSIPLGRTTDVPILLINRGFGPLRKLLISIPELDWRVQIPLLRAEESREIAFSFKPEHRGKQQLNALWKAERINGSSVDGREELSFEASPIEISSSAHPFQSNPYVTGGPVDTEGTFFGREDVIDRIHRLLRTEGPSTVILVEGNRRAGKTSILKRVQKSDQLKQWVSVYCQFQGISGEPNAQSLYRLVAREILNAVSEAPTGPVPEQLRKVVQARSSLERISLCRVLASSIDEERPFERFEELLQLALAASSPRRILLMLDEFEKIHQGIEQGQMSPLVPENFRYVFQTYPEVSGILSGSIRIKRLRKEYWNVLYGIGTPIPIGPLSPTAARELVIRPAQGVLNYSEQAIDRVLELCAFQPFLIQSLASAIFEACATSNLFAVTTELVNQSANALALNSEHFYTVFRQESLTARQRFISCLIDSLRDTSAHVTFDVIRDQLETQGIPVESDLQLKADLEDLQEREIIGFVADTPVGHYRVQVPLFSQWLRAKVDFQAERREAIEE